MKENIFFLLIIIAVISVLGLGVWLLFGNGDSIVSSMANSVSNAVKSSTAKAKIINLHSHPQQGENWIISFETEGTADLKIVPDGQDTIDDDEFVGLYCDDKELTPQILQGDVIYYKDWNCQGIGQVVHYTKKAGKHTFKFVFGDDELFAYNSAAWFNPAWTKRKKITIQQANIDASLSNFPLMVKVSSDSNMGAYVRSDGNDVLFTKDDGITQLSHEEEWFASDGGNASGIYWVDVPSILTVASGSATDIYMYYGNNNASDQQQATKVWKDASAQGVWHLGESSGTAADSSGNGNAGTFYGDLPDSRTGQIGNAQDLDGTGDYISVNNSTSLQITNNLSICAWCYVADRRFIVAKALGDDFHYDYGFYVTAGANLSLYYANLQTVNGTAILTKNQWQHLCVTANNSATTFYINGTADIKPGAVLTNNNYNLAIGKENNFYYTGLIDNLIIYNKILGAAEVKFSYYNQDATASGGDYELTWGTEETYSSVSYKLFKGNIKFGR